MRQNLRFFLIARQQKLTLKGELAALFPFSYDKNRKLSLMLGSDSLYAHNFRFYFTPLPGVLLTFPSRYLFTIDHKTYLALEGGPSGFRQGFTCPVLLDKVIKRFPTLGIPGFHGLWRTFPDPSARLGNF
jgi:hypothetical protein